MSKLATLKELRDDYNVDEMLQLYEAVLVNNYNKDKMMKGVKDGRK